MYPFAEHQQQCQRSMSTSSGGTFTFVFLKSIIMAATISLGRPYARNICSVFPLRKIKDGKAVCIDEIAPENMEDNEILYRHAVYNKNKIERWTKVCMLLSPKKNYLWIA